MPLKPREAEKANQNNSKKHIARKRGREAGSMKNALTVTRTAEIRAAQNAYFMAKALEETIKAEAAEIKRKILEAGNFQIDDELWELLSPAEREAEPRRITDPEQDYEMGKEAFGEYLKKCYAENLNPHCGI